MHSRNLPPLDLLAPFEASARHGSFTRAAEELLVTQSAVSQRVRKLEDLLGTQLFERRHRAIALTPEGRELLNGVTVALRHLSAATQGVRQQDKRPRVKLAVDTSIGQHWLMPRLARVMGQEATFTCDLLVSDSEQDVLKADVAILHGDGTWTGHTARLLFADEIFPVCTAEYLARVSVETTDDLLKADLIDLDYLHWNWINWGIWLTEAGLDPTEARILMRTNSYTAQLDAARAGLGVALGWRHLLEQDLQSGALIRPIPESVGTEYGYYVLVRDGVEDVARTLAGQLLAMV